MRAFLVDDEPLALERLSRMLEATGRVEIAGSNTDPVSALEQLRRLVPEVLFLDIHMPGLSGFELLAELPAQPLVIFTTAYDRYALEAFRVNAIDYLLKPIEPELLDRALAKAERMTSHGSGLRRCASFWRGSEPRCSLGKVPGWIGSRRGRAIRWNPSTFAG